MPNTENQNDNSRPEYDTEVDKQELQKQNDDRAKEDTNRSNETIQQ